jgi:hypothetical protein
MTGQFLLEDATTAFLAQSLAILIGRLTDEPVERMHLRPCKAGFLAEYDRCVSELEERLLQSARLSVWVFLRRERLRSVLGVEFDYEELVQLLMLTFPDVTWHLLPKGPSEREGLDRFLSGGPCRSLGRRDGKGLGRVPFNREDVARSRRIRRSGELLVALAEGIRLQTLGQDPIFDADGLQGIIRRSINKGGYSIPVRRLRAVAIDEEDDYAYFNAYTAFRFGLRAEVVNTETLAVARFGEPGSGRRTFLTFEDRCINFPDKGTRLANGRLSDYASRDKCLPGLADLNPPASPDRVRTRFRIEVTIGSGTSVDNHKGVRFHRTVYKPLPGMFALWQRSGMRKVMRSLEKGNAKRSGYAPGFSGMTPARDNVHSAPGRLLLVASRLISRGEVRFSSIHSVRDAIRGAIFATQAAELLNRLTPTTAYEALSLKHCFETMAECQFNGIEGMLDLQARFREIDQETKAISSLFDPLRQRHSELNAKQKITSRLATIFRGMNYFDEDQVCTSEGRKISRKFWFARKGLAFPLFQWPRRAGFRGRGLGSKLKAGLRIFARTALTLAWAPFQLIVQLPFLYFDKIVSSFSFFLCFVVLIPLAFGTALFGLDGSPVGQPSARPAVMSCACQDKVPYANLGDKAWKCMAMSASTFFALQPSGDLAKDSLDITRPNPTSFLWLLETILGLLHMGFFISMIYDRLSRR